MAIQLVTVKEPISYIFKLTGEGVFTLMTANLLTGEVGSAYLPPVVKTMLTERLQAIMLAAPNIGELQDAFPGIVQSLVSTRLLEPGPTIPNPAHIEVSFPFSTSSYINQWANGQNGSNYGLLKTVFDGTNLTVIVDPIPPPPPACAITWAAGVTLPRALWAPAVEQFADGRTVVVTVSGGTNPFINTVQTYVISADGLSVVTAGAIPTITANYFAFNSIIRLGDGRILHYGKYVSGGSSISTAGTLDPVTLLWTSRPASSLHTTDAMKVRLDTGNILDIGGYIGPSVYDVTPSMAEYSQTLNTWTMKQQMLVPRVYFVAVTLNDGRVLAAGGNNDNNETVESAEIYDPGLDEWTPAAWMNIPRKFAGFVKLPDGRVLVAGGQNGGSVQDSSEIYDPVLNTWSSFSLMPGAKLCADTLSPGRGLVLLDDGQVYFVGGSDGSFTPTTSVFVYNIGTNTWALSAPTTEGRNEHGVVRIGDCTLLAIGGRGDVGQSFDSTEIG